MMTISSYRIYLNFGRSPNIFLDIHVQSWLFEQNYTNSNSNLSFFTNCQN
jgi:hypothetical protein